MYVFFGRKENEDAFRKMSIIGAGRPGLKRWLGECDSNDPATAKIVTPTSYSTLSGRVNSEQTSQIGSIHVTGGETRTCVHVIGLATLPNIHSSSSRTRRELPSSFWEGVCSCWCPENRESFCELCPSGGSSTMTAVGTSWSKKHSRWHHRVIARDGC